MTMIRSRSALHEERVARKRYRCEATYCEFSPSRGWSTDPGWIVPGQRYVLSSLPPGSGDIGNTVWWHARFHEECIEP